MHTTEHQRATPHAEATTPYTRQTIALNADEWQQAIELLENPPKPNDKLQALFARGGKKVSHPCHQ